MSTIQEQQTAPEFTPQEWNSLVARFAEMEKKLGTSATLPQQNFEELPLRGMMPSKEDIPLVVAGLGAGSGSFVSGLLQSKIKQLANYPPEYIEIIAGFLAYKYFQKSRMAGSNYLSAFMGGVVIGGVGALAEKNGLTLGKLGIKSSGGDVYQARPSGGGMTVAGVMI